MSEGKLENREFEIRGMKKKYSDLLEECLNNPPQGGFSVREMKERTRILDSVEKSNGEIIIEGRDIAKVKDCVASYRWLIISKDVIKFVEEVAEL